MNTRLISEQVSSLHHIESSGHSNSNHLLPFPEFGLGFLSETYRAGRPLDHPHPSGL